MTRLDCLKLSVVTCALAAGLPPSECRAGFRVDYILSDQYFPELRDAWMTRINNQGVAAGYIATESDVGPYLATTYAGSGPFNTLGISSTRYSLIATGIDNRGVVVGNLFDSSFRETPYIYSGGSVQYLNLPPGGSGEFDGITPQGTAYGRLSASGVSSLFTYRDGVMTSLALSAPGIEFFFTGERSLNDAGILSVYGLPTDHTASNVAFLYNTNTRALSPVAIPAGYDRVRIDQVAGSGIIYGTATTSNFSRSESFLFNADGSVLRSLGAPSGTYNILFNNVGQAVGLNGERLTLFDGTRWTTQDLSGLNGYTLDTLSDFNDRGQIVGLVLNPQGDFLWGFTASTVPEPSSLCLVGIGACGALVIARRRGGARSPGTNQLGG